MLVGTGYAYGTAISGSGGSATLTAGGSESKPTVTIRVVYPGEHSTSKDVTVSVGAPTLKVATTRYIPAAKAGDSSDWIEIATYGGHSLIIRKDRLADAVTVVSRDYVGTDKQAAVNNWFAGTATLAANAPLRNYVTQNDAISTLGVLYDSVDSFSKPVQGTAGATGNDVAFLGSADELMRFCSLMVTHTAGNYIASSADAKANYNMLNWNHKVEFLRSTSPHSSHGAGTTLYYPTYPSYGGLVCGTNNSYDPLPYYIRPMMWIDNQAGAALFESR
jgi:outer membrane protein assembly factor BamA